jgi:signal transduction histidine kinase
MAAGPPRLDDEAIEEILAVLSRPEDDELQEIVRLAADLCEVEVAGLTVLHQGDYHICVTHGMAPKVRPSDDTFCQFTMTTEGTYHVHDALTDPRFTDLGWVNGEFGYTRFYASAPVHSPGGAMLGRLCVVSPEPKTLTALQERALEALAASVTRIIELRLTRRRRRDQGTGPEITLTAQLAAELSHDMRVPLTSIQASVEMLQDVLGDAPDPAVRMLLARTAAAAGRMARMLDQVLHFGSIDDHPELTTVDLNKLLEQVVTDSAGVLEPRQATVTVEGMPMVRADPDEMYSLFQNLITNSAKFARPGEPPRIRVSAESAGDFCRVRVVDNGIGIPDDRREEVFGLFTRLDHATEGHGIGLAAAARIAAAHGGEIGAEEAPGGGTEIWVELPAADADGVRAAP